MPPLPHIQQFFRIATRRKDVGYLVDVQTRRCVTGAAAVLALAVFPFEPCAQARQLVALGLVVRRRCRQLQLQQLQLAGIVFGQGHPFETAGATRELRNRGREIALCVGGNLLRIDSDEVVLHPRRTGALLGERLEAFFGGFDEAVRFVGAWPRRFAGLTARSQNEAQRSGQREQVSTCWHSHRLPCVGPLSRSTIQPCRKT